ncbi:MAG: DUF421 domain-containing protein [Ruminococcus sp.]|nr:DUF421 domain-containing protein [Ruminococcus sp.]
MLAVFFRGTILYIIIIFAVRLMGKRQIGELQPSELVVTIMLSNIATLPMEDLSIPMAMGVVPILTMVALDVFVSQLCLRSEPIRRAVSGSARVIVSGGKADKKMLRELRFTPEDLMAALRSQGIFDLKDVQFAVVETTGKVSAAQKSSAAPISPDDLGLETSECDPPMMIVSDGSVEGYALKSLGFDRKWLEKQLSERKLRLEDVYIMTADRSGSCTFIMSDKKDKN